MASNGYRIFDCDLHVCEPVDLWQRYIDPRFVDQAPVGSPSTGPFNDMNLMVEGKLVNHHGSPKEWDDDIAFFTAERHGRTDIYVEYERRVWDAGVQLDAMEREGIDMASRRVSSCCGAESRRAEGLSFPDRDRVVPELRAVDVFMYREPIEAPWRLVYRHEKKRVYVLAVLDSRRDLSGILSERLTR